MKRLLTILLFCPALSYSAPFVVSDILSAGVIQCGIYLDAAPKVTINVTALAGGNICQYDLAGIPVGAHSIAATAITVNDPVWGSQESAKSLPLAFSRPGTLPAPAGLQLRP